MTFQYPANPADGDIIVQPQPDGTLIKGTYHADTNTWAVGQLPEEPGVPGPPGPKGDQGDKGDPGQGVNISGSVPTFSDLDTPNNHTYQFWIVDDTNTLYYSDGNAWLNLGSPIEGPQGDPGTDGTDGTDGEDGAPGKGWTSTTIIDETDQSPPNYQVRFNSDDGLGFITTNLVGPQGEVGVIPQASSTVLGGIKIGRGINIDETGTATMGEVNVDLETVPLTPEGTIYNYSYTVGYAPYFFTLGSEQSQDFPSGGSNATFGTGTHSQVMPDDANRALTYVFASTSCQPSSSGALDGQMSGFRAYLGNRINLTNATYIAGATSVQGFAHNHNLTVPYTSGHAANRVSLFHSTKINVISFEPGANITFDWTQEIKVASPTTISGGTSRVIVVPYKQDAAVTSNYLAEAYEISPGVWYDGESHFTETPELMDSIYPPISPEEWNANGSIYMKIQIDNIFAAIMQARPYADAGTQAVMDTLLQDCHDLRTLPGTVEEIWDVLYTYIQRCNTLTNYTFRFEV